MIPGEIHELLNADKVDEDEGAMSFDGVFESIRRQWLAAASPVAQGSLTHHALTKSGFIERPFQRHPSHCTLVLVTRNQS